MDETYVKQLMEAQEVSLTTKQAKIIISAIEIFAEKGYAATSTSEIAKQAGVAEGTIFRHFPTKKDLLLSIVKPGLMKLAVPFFASQMVNDIFKKEFNEFEDLLRAFITNRLEFVEGNLPLIKIVLQEIAFHEEIQIVLKENFQAKVYPRLEEVIIAFQKQGKLKEFPIPTIIRFSLSTFLGFVITRYIVMPNKQWDNEREIDDMITFIMNGIESGQAI
ncbi:TetR/AcrR family transcriptional regulator [Radiobacillus sp. PE A8.2]|uniref:TetR/AcrR family transcriptional regulator n=1 Tax=Radiobacillus sp. PE A8.2 TaxID=3380349 RepID=UPI00388DA7C2